MPGRTRPATGCLLAARDPRLARAEPRRQGGPGGGRRSRSGPRRPVCALPLPRGARVLCAAVACRAAQRRPGGVRASAARDAARRRGTLGAPPLGRGALSLVAAIPAFYLSPKESGRPRRQCRRCCCRLRRAPAHTPPVTPPPFHPLLVKKGPTCARQVLKVPVLICAASHICARAPWGQLPDGAFAAASMLAHAVSLVHASFGSPFPPNPLMPGNARQKATP